MCSNSMVRPWTARFFRWNSSLPSSDTGRVMDSDASIRTTVGMMAEVIYSHSDEVMEAPTSYLWEFAETEHVCWEVGDIYIFFLQHNTVRAWLFCFYKKSDTQHHHPFITTHTSPQGSANTYIWHYWLEINTYSVHLHNAPRNDYNPPCS